MLEILIVLSESDIVHADIKPDNILLILDSETHWLQSIKLIDFGSSFFFSNAKYIAMSTPEYLCPEALEYL